MSEETAHRSRGQGFVAFVLQRCQQDTGEAARLRRADNPATEYQSWATLAAFGVDLEKPWERLPFACVAAALARAKVERDGLHGIGRALAGCYEEGNQSDQAGARLRRLLACDSVEEACRILRPLLGLIGSHGRWPLSHARLLDELLVFHWRAQDIKARWAQDFYCRPPETEEQAR
ncbi:MAG: type I-E CRISPR-associated protein Cse2/CasB [Acidobacteriota bacterium]|nr:type I-E CRISPR-associated protein Cse2/CasB [Acidobacteriota bacterium]